MEVVKMKNPFELFPMEIWELLFDQMENSKDILTVLHGIPKLDSSIGNQKRMWLIDQILPFLYNLIDKKDVLNLRLVCKQWQCRVEYFLQNQPYYRAYSEDLHKDNLNFWDFLNQYEENKFVGPVMIQFDPDHRDLMYSEELADEIVEYSQSTRRNPFVFRELSLDIVPADIKFDNENPFGKVFAFLEQVGTHVWYLDIDNRGIYPIGSKNYKRIQEISHLANLLKHTPNLKRLRLSLPLPFAFWKDTFEPNPNETNLPELPFLETIEMSAGVWQSEIFESLWVILNCYGSQIRRLKFPVLKRWEERDVEWLARLFPQLTELQLDVDIYTYKDEDDFIINLKSILCSISSPNLVKLLINVWSDGSCDPPISIEEDILKWLKRFRHIKYFELLTHPSSNDLFYERELIDLKEKGTSDPTKDLVPSLQTFKIVDPGYRLSYNFLRCFPSLRTFQIKAVSIEDPNCCCSGRKPLKSVKLYESNIWKVLPKLKTASFAKWMVRYEDIVDDSINHKFVRETFLKLIHAGKILSESHLDSSSTKAIQIFVNDKDN